MGRKSEWNHLPTTNPRVPKNLAKTLLGIAKALDTKTPRELTISVDGVDFEISVKLKQVDSLPSSTCEIELSESEISDSISLAEAYSCEHQPEIMVEVVEHSEPELTVIELIEPSEVEPEISDNLSLTEVNGSQHHSQTIDELVELPETDCQPEIVDEPVEDFNSIEQPYPILPELVPQIEVQAPRLTSFSISDFGMQLYTVWKKLACQHSDSNPWGTPIELNQIYRHGFSDLIGQQFLLRIEQLISAGLQKTGDLELTLLPGNLNLKIAGRDVESITYQIFSPNSSVKTTLDNSNGYQLSQQFPDRQTVHQDFERLRRERQKRIANGTPTPPSSPTLVRRERDGFLSSLSRLLSF